MNKCPICNRECPTPNGLVVHIAGEHRMRATPVNYAVLVEENAALREAAENLANAVVAYFNKRGVAHAERKGNEDIAAMADALSDYGYQMTLAAPQGGGET